MKTYTICADGACSGNPGPGGYAYEIWETLEGFPIFPVASGDGWETQTTNNIMELMGLRDALQMLLRMGGAPCQTMLRLDSEYVLKGLFTWLPDWTARGWRTANKKAVKNQELWKELDGLAAQLTSRGFTLEPDWVRGHAGDFLNERVDFKAVEMRNRATQEA